MKALVWILMISVSVGAGGFSTDAAAAKKTSSKKSIKKARKSKSSKVGAALRPKKNHNFDGMTVEGIEGGRYDSFTNLSEDGDRGGNRLYGLPADFSYRAADEKAEMRYRQ